MKRESYILILALLALTACSDKPNDEPSDLVSLDLLTPVIVAENESRYRPVEGSEFGFLPINENTPTPNRDYNTYYETSFFVCDKGTFTPHIVGANNSLYRYIVYYRYVTGAITHTWPEGTPRARIGRNIDIYAYYPYVKNTFNPDAVPFTTNQQYDWMWADPVTIDNVSTENKTVPLKFHHAMTCIEVRLSTRYTSSIDLYQIKLSDAQSKLVSSGTINITNGSLNYNSSQPSITISGNNYTNRLPVHRDDNNSYLSYSFIMPEKEFSDGDLKLTFFYDRSSTWPYPSVQSRADFTIPTTFTNSEGNEVSVTKFETGKRYILNLMIDNTDLIVPLSFVKDDWVTNDVNLKI